MAFTRNKLYTAITNPRTGSLADIHFGLQEGRFQASIITTSGWSVDPTFVEFQWIRVENTVTCSGSVENFIPAVIPTDNIVEFTLPFTPNDDLNKDRINGGCVGCRANEVVGNGCVSQGVTSARNADIIYNTTSTAGGQAIQFQFKYQINNL